MLLTYLVGKNLPILRRYFKLANEKWVDLPTKEDEVIWFVGKSCLHNSKTVWRFIILVVWFHFGYNSIS